MELVWKNLASDRYSCSFSCSISRSFLLGQKVKSKHQSAIELSTNRIGKRRTKGERNKDAPKTQSPLIRRLPFGLALGDIEVVLRPLLHRHHRFRQGQQLQLERDHPSESGRGLTCVVINSLNSSNFFSPSSLLLLIVSYRLS